MVQIPILQLLSHPLLLVLLGRKGLRGIMAVSMLLEEPRRGVSMTLTKTTKLLEHSFWLILPALGRPHSHHQTKHKQTIHIDTKGKLSQKAELR